MRGATKANTQTAILEMFAPENRGGFADHWRTMADLRCEFPAVPRTSLYAWVRELLDQGRIGRTWDRGAWSYHEGDN